MSLAPMVVLSSPFVSWRFASLVGTAIAVPMLSRAAMMVAFMIEYATVDRNRPNRGDSNESDKERVWTCQRYNVTSDCS